jgi:hypothetical protein
MHSRVPGQPSGVVQRPMGPSTHLASAGAGRLVHPRRTITAQTTFVFIGTVALAGVRVGVGWRSPQSDPASPE